MRGGGVAMGGPVPEASPAMDAIGHWLWRHRYQILMALAALALLLLPGLDYWWP